MTHVKVKEKGQNKVGGPELKGGPGVEGRSEGQGGL